MALQITSTNNSTQKHFRDHNDNQNSKKKDIKNKHSYILDKTKQKIHKPKSKKQKHFGKQDIFQKTK